MVTYEQACDIAASVFPGSVFSSALEYSGGWVYTLEDPGWTEDQPRDEFGVSIIVRKSDGEWKYFNVGNPEFFDVLDVLEPVALPEKYVALIRPKGDADQDA